MRLMRYMAVMKASSRKDKVACHRELGERGWFQQYDDVCIQPKYFVDGYGDTSPDEAMPILVKNWLWSF